jgi:hypothetical protein
MASFWSIGFGLLSGVAGWMISEFLAKPFRRGIDLVADARTSVLVYANVEARAKMTGTSYDGYAAHVELTEEAEARLGKAEEVPSRIRRQDAGILRERIARPRLFFARWAPIFAQPELR